MSKTFRFSEAMDSDDPLVAAQAYIDAGLKVVVTHGVTQDGKCTCGKIGCKVGKHPFVKYFPNGALSATTDIGLVRRALKAEPDANLAVTLDNLTVVDIDGPEGKEHVASLNLEKTLATISGRGGHRFFQGNIEGGSFKAPQVDVLTGPNHYVMVPPSIHESGKQYRWRFSKIAKAAPVPAKLKKLRKHEPRSVTIARALIRKGGRNETLFKMACSLQRWLSPDQVLAALTVINETACETPLSKAELETIVNSGARYKNEGEPLFGPPKVRESLPQEFLWYPYIPRHAVTIIAGDPGRGKSLLIALLIAIVTGDEKMRLAGERIKGQRVLLLSAEDSWARVTLARLEKAGFDISNLHVMHRFRALTEERLEELASHMREWRPDLVVIDTLSAYMGGARDMHRQNEVGEFLGMLNEIAEETGAAVVGLAHLNKQGNEFPLYRIVGSIGFAATIRSALFLGTDPDNPKRLALAHGKTNGSEEGRTIIFERVGGGRHDVPVLKAVGYSDATASDVCRIEKGPVGRPSAEREAAITFVLGALTDEPVAWETLQRSAEARAVASPSTLNQVRADLAKEGKIVQVGKGKATKWKLGAPRDD